MSFSVHVPTCPMCGSDTLKPVLDGRFRCTRCGVTFRLR